MAYSSKFTTAWPIFRVPLFPCGIKGVSFPEKIDTLTLKCVNFVNFVNFWKEKSHRFRDGIFLFIRSRIYSSPS